MVLRKGFFGRSLGNLSFIVKLNIVLRTVIIEGAFF